MLPVPKPGALVIKLMIPPALFIVPAFSILPSEPLLANLVCNTICPPPLFSVPKLDKEALVSIPETPVFIFISPPLLSTVTPVLTAIVETLGVTVY